MSYDFLNGWDYIQKKCHELSKKNGFWPPMEEIAKPYEKLAKLALIQSEISECLEAARSNEEVMDKHLVDMPAEAVELADAVIRIMDYAEAYDLPVADAILDKHEFNSSRPYKHGKNS